MVAMFKMVLVLSMLCAISGFLLSSLKTSTADLIERQVLTYVQEPAIINIFPYSDNDPIAERLAFNLSSDPTKSAMLFPYKKDGKLIGLAIENSAQGYGGELGVMVGFDLETNELIGIGITTFKETPGIGTRILEPFFIDKFTGITSDQAQNVDTLSGATISSVAVLNAIEKASKDYFELKDTALTTWNNS